MFIETIRKTIYRMYFEKCTIYVNSFSGVFLSNDKNNLSIKDFSNRALLKMIVKCKFILYIMEVKNILILEIMIITMLQCHTIINLKMISY